MVGERHGGQGHLGLTQQLLGGWGGQPRCGGVCCDQAVKPLRRWYALLTDLSSAQADTGLCRTMPRMMWGEWPTPVWIGMSSGCSPASGPVTALPAPGG